MDLARIGCLLALAALPAAVSLEAMAQIPAHKPGTICFTRALWCWASPPGVPGRPCSCPTPYGPVVGVLG